MNHESFKPKPGTGIFYTFMFIVGVAFLLMLPIQTEQGPPGQGWWTQPVLMPAISLWLVALPATYLFFRYVQKLRANKALQPSQNDVRAELIQWIRPLEFFIYYILYIWLLGIVGYFLSSLIFIIILSLRVGLRSPRWMLASVLFAFALVAMFRWSLEVWIPPAQLYDLFPKDIRIFLMRNF
ncbi:MAG: tripartite tricarboxylate transporter TctB family protein [Chloroflexota bacterium]